MTRERDMRLTGGVIEDFNVSPRDLASPSRAEHLENGLFRGEPTGDARDGVLVLFAVGPFGGRQHTGQKPIWMLAPDFFNSLAFDQVNSVSNESHAGILPLAHEFRRTEALVVIHPSAAAGTAPAAAYHEMTVEIGRDSGDPASP